MIAQKGSIARKNRKAIFRLARRFDAESGRFWAKRRSFRCFQQALARLFMVIVGGNSKSYRQKQVVLLIYSPKPGKLNRNLKQKEAAT